MRIGDEMHPRISFSRSGFSTPTGSDHQINASPIQEMGTSLLNDTLAVYLFLHLIMRYYLHT